MTREQVGILNALVTCAMESMAMHREDEIEVAKLVGSWCLSPTGPLIVEPSMRVVVGGEMGHALTEGGRYNEWWSRCSCGWESGPRPNQHRAYADWLAHAADQIPAEVKRYVAGRGVRQ